MRNASQISRARLAGDGGAAAPSPGRAPADAKKMETKPASSSMPSDWYDENTCAPEINDRNAITATATARRGQRLTSSNSEAASPTPTSADSAASPLPSQSRVGTSQSARASPSSARAARR